MAHHANFGLSHRSYAPNPSDFAPAFLGVLFEPLSRKYIPNTLKADKCLYLAFAPTKTFSLRSNGPTAWILCRSMAEYSSTPG
jgi:hypothetical protein